MKQEPRRGAANSIPVCVQHHFVDGSLVLVKGAVDGPGTRDVAAVAVQLAPGVHQQQLSILNPLHSKAGVLIICPRLLWKACIGKCDAPAAHNSRSCSKAGVS